MSWIHIRTFVFIFSLLSNDHISHGHLRKRTDSLGQTSSPEKSEHGIDTFEDIDLSSRKFRGERKRPLSNYDLDLYITRKSREKRDILSEDPCYVNGLCRNNKNLETAKCYCDSKCNYFGDCCYDSDFQNSNLSLSSLKHEQFKCVFIKTRYTTSVGCVMVVACPKSYVDDAISSQCSSGQKLYHRLPVWDENGIVYYNAFCAICNNVTTYRMARVSFNVVENCFGNTSLENIILYPNGSENCRPMFIPPDGLFFRLCFTSLYFGENNSCKLYQNPVQYKTKIYKNYFCNPVKISHFQKYDCLSMETDKFFNIFPLTVLFTFSSPEIVSEKSSCQNIELFDDKSNVCLKLDCESGLAPHDGLCQKIPSFSNYKFQLNFTFSVNKSIGENYLKRAIFFLFKVLSIRYYQLTPIKVSFYINNGVQWMAKSSCAEIKANIEFSITNKFVTLAEIEILKNYLQNISFTYIETKESDGQLVTMKRSLPEVDDTECEMIFEEADVYKWDIKDGQVLFQYVGNAHLKTDKDSFCLDVRVNTMLLKNSNKIKILSLSCENELQKPRKYKSNNVPINLQIILTYVCMGISCASLTISIFIYRALSFSQSVPGSNTENLLITMLLAHALFMIGIGANDNQMVCLCLGIAIHYLWLSSFTFMSIAVLHLTITFSKIVKNPNSHKAPSRYLKRGLTVLGCTLPLIFIFPCILLEFMDLSTFRIGYNGRICFPTEYPAIIIFVSGPIILSISINVICLAIVIGSICRQTTNCKEIDKSFLSYLPVYARLCVLSGCLWIFGILSAVLEQPVWQNLFIVFGSLQGFFVSISCTCTVRIYKSLKVRSQASSNNSQFPLQQIRNGLPEL